MWYLCFYYYYIIPNTKFSYKYWQHLICKVHYCGTLNYTGFSFISILSFIFFIFYSKVQTFHILFEYKKYYTKLFKIIRYIINKVNWNNLNKYNLKPTYTYLIVTTYYHIMKSHNYYIENNTQGWILTTITKPWDFSVNLWPSGILKKILLMRTIIWVFLIFNIF